MKEAKNTRIYTVRGGSRKVYAWLR